MTTVKKNNSNKFTSTGIGIVKPPPEVNVPTAPAGFVPSNPKDYRGFRPKSSELAVVPDVVLELGQFHDYVTVFGQTAPPVGGVTQALDAAAKWTALLADSTDWIDYVKSQEGMAWKDSLTLVDKLKAPFALASSHDPTLLARYPALARLISAGKVIARRGAATKKRNLAADLGTGATPAPGPAASAAPTARGVSPPAAPGVGPTAHGNGLSG